MTKDRVRAKRKSGPSPAVEVAKELRNAPKLSDVVTLSTGVRVRLVPVAAHLVDEVMFRIKDPEVPVQYIEEKGREEPNPDHPEYRKALADAEHDRGVAVSDAMILFGVELVDGVPEDDTWLKKLRYLEKRGWFSLDGYDLDDPMDLEFVYKKYVAIGAADVVLLGNVSRLSQEEVDLAARGFQGDQGRPPDNQRSAKESA